MINIRNHPIWKSKAYGSISPWKKHGHLLRFLIASQYAKLFPRSIFIGVTGSVGKTTVVAATQSVLSQKYQVLSTLTNLDPLLNIPITLLKVRKNTAKVLLEMGIEYPGEMEFYLSLVRPATGVVTAVSLQHSEYLGDLDNIANEKSKLVEQLPEDGFAILNWDDVRVRRMVEKTKAQVIFFGSDPKNCHLWADKIKVKNFKTCFELNAGVERVEVESQLLGSHQIIPLMAAAALGVVNDIPLTSIKKSLEKVEPPMHRMQVLSGVSDSIILDDTYNAAPRSVEEALDTLNLIPAKRRIAVLGEMRELGEFTEKMHRQVARKVYNNSIDLVFLGTGDAHYIYDELTTLGFKTGRIEKNMANVQIINKLRKILTKGDVVLIKGARKVHLEEVVANLVKGMKK